MRQPSTPSQVRLHLRSLTRSAANLDCKQSLLVVTLQSLFFRVGTTYEETEIWQSRGMLREPLGLFSSRCGVAVVGLCCCRGIGETLAGWHHAFRIKSNPALTTLGAWCRWWSPPRCDRGVRFFLGRLDLVLTFIRFRLLSSRFTPDGFQARLSVF